MEADESFTEFRSSHYMVSFLADDIVRLRYVDIDRGVELTSMRLMQYRAVTSGNPAYWRSP